MKRQGLTLLETMVVIPIMLVIASFFYPVMVGAKRSARETRSKLSMKQIYTALMVYAADWGGGSDYGDAPSMGFPTDARIFYSLFDRQLAFQGCQFSPEANVALVYTPVVSPEFFGDDARDCKAEMPLVVDVTCNEFIPQVLEHRFRKILAVNLGGAARSKTNNGNYYRCKFWIHK